MRRKFWFLTGICAIGIPLAVVATAFACGSLATLKLNRATATSGVDVRAVGGNFNSNPRASTVQLRFNSRNGRVLWEGRPAANGKFTADFKAPGAAAGSYVILATQTGPDGRPAAGTPGRAPLKFKKTSNSSTTSDSSTAVAAWSSPQGGPPAASDGTSISLGLVSGLGLFALASLGGGGLLVKRSRRRELALAHTLS